MMSNDTKSLQINHDYYDQAVRSLLLDPTLFASFFVAIDRICLKLVRCKPKLNRLSLKPASTRSQMLPIACERIKNFMEP